MRLPKHKLDQVDWWSSQMVAPFLSMGRDDVVTIHWKQWWKPRTKIRFPRVCTDVNGDIYTYSATEEFIALHQQLSSLP